MDYKKILAGYLSSTLKMDDGKIAELLDGENITEESAISTLLGLNKELIAKVQEDAKKDDMSFQDRYAKTKKEVLDAFEQNLKDTYGISSNLTGTNLIAEIVKTSVDATGKGKEMTEDEIKKHPAYIAMVSDYKKQLTDKENEHTAKITEIETTQKRETSQGKAKEKALAYLEGLKVVKPANANVAAKTQENFLRELAGYDFEFQDGSDEPIVTLNGKTVDDGHGHPKSFKEVVEGITGFYYDFQGNNGGQNAGNRNNPDNGGKSLPRFKSQKEADDYMLDDSIELNDRIAAIDAYKAESNQ